MENADFEHCNLGSSDSLGAAPDKVIMTGSTCISDSGDGEALNSFWQRQARRMTRNSCIYFWTSLSLSIGLSVVAMVVGQFSVHANTVGWQSRGTMIADRQTQVMIASYNQDYLFYAGDSAWENLIKNVQHGWQKAESTDKSYRRSLQPDAAVHDTAVEQTVQAETLSRYLTPKAERNVISQPALRKEAVLHKEAGFRFSANLKRNLQAQADQLQGCDVEWYTSTNLTNDDHLWPVWKVQGKATTALDPDVIHDICVAELNTQKYLEDHGLCFGCQVGCLPPYSIVLFARLTVPNGTGLSCIDLSDAWAAYQASTEAQFKSCVADLNALGAQTTDSLPASCPFGFAPFLIDENFEKTSKVVYTSSIFATQHHAVHALYAGIGSYDRSSGEVVQGNYDLQDQDFVKLYVNQALGRDTIMALGSAAVVALAILVHTRSPAITVVGLIQILLSFPLSFLVYKLIAGLDFFPFLNFIGIFVAFALGAGDIFVAFDKWKNVRSNHPNATSELVAANALPDAGGAMFLTTITTAIAFFSTAICSVAPVKMFAIFCGLLIMFDYLMNIALVFPALCIYDTISANPNRKANCFVTLSCFESGGSKESARDTESDQNKDAASGKPSLVHTILLGFYFLLHKLRWVLFVVCIGSFAITTYYASTLQLPTSSDVRLLNDHCQYELNYQWRLNLLSSARQKAAGSIAVVIWGVKPADTGDHSK